MLALILSILGIVEADPNLLLGAALGASGSVWTATITQRGSKGSLSRIEGKLAHLETRIDTLYSSATKATNTKVVQQASGETVVTVTPHEDMASLVAQVKANEAAASTTRPGSSNG